MKKILQEINIIIFSFLFSLIFVLIYLLLPFKNLLNTTLINDSLPKKITICLDAGHGGIDGGAVGSFLEESEVNLKITKKLTNLFLASKFTVVNTRTEDICLCDERSPSFKLDDMKKRREIIQNSNADILISIHCNKFHLSSSVGAQIFYQTDSNESKNFAEILTNYFIENLPNARKFSLSGDYYVLNSVSKIPAILIECGYLSNPAEEKLLSTDEYQNKIAYLIYSGTLKYIYLNT